MSSKDTDSDCSSDESLVRSSPPPPPTVTAPLFNKKTILIENHTHGETELEDLFPVLSVYERNRRKFLKSRSDFWLVFRLYFIMGIISTAFIYLFIVFLNRVAADSIDQQQHHHRTSTTGWNQTEPNRTTYQISLDPSDKYRLFWNVDYSTKSVLFELRLIQQHKLIWFAFGFSNKDSIANADLCLLWYDKQRKIHFKVSPSPHSPPTQQMFQLELIFFSFKIL